MSKFILTVTFMLKLPLSQKPADRPFKTTLFTVALLPLALALVLHAKTYENYLQLVLLFFKRRSKGYKYFPASLGKG